MAMSDKVHLWDALALPQEGLTWTKCGLRITKPTNVLYAATAEKLKVPPALVCRTCYRLGPPWLVAVK
jgi:hypothetical protein